MRKFIFATLLFFIFVSCNNLSQNSTDNKFIGLWKYYSSEKGTANDDGSMGGVIGTLKKVDGTNETYVFDYLNFELLFSKKDDNTLQGVDNKLSLEYNETNQHLILHTNATSYNEFTKLK